LPDRVIEVCTVLLVTVSGHVFAGETMDLLYQDGFEDQPFQLECEKFNFPCSLSEADPDALARADALLGELWDIRMGGTLDDCHDHLLSQNDVVLIFRGEHSLSFQVEGMMPVVFHEIPALPAENKRAASSITTNSVLAKSTTKIHNSPANLPTGRRPGRSWSAHNRLTGQNSYLIPGQPGSTTNEKFSTKTRPNRVVGIDTDSNGIVDQRDTKLAWLLSPFEFLPFNSGINEIAELLRDIPAYQGNVYVQSNLQDTDNNVDLFWQTLAVPDVLVISTFTGFDDAIFQGRKENYFWISSGTPAPSDYAELEGIVTFGVTFGIHFDESETLDPLIARRLVFNKDFFHGLGQQDKKQVMVFTHDVPTGISLSHVSLLYSTSLGRQGEDAPVADLSFYFLELFNGLAQGLNVDNAIRAAQPERPVGYVAYHNTPGGRDDGRIIELPRLMIGDVEAPLGFPLLNDVTGIVGDNSNDRLKLKIQIDGVTAPTLPGFSVRFRIDEQAVPGSYDLNSASNVSGHPYRYEATYDLDLGFPLQSGPVPIEIIVDLPDKGESRYTGKGNLSDCWFIAKFEGEVSGAFAGPAGYNLNGGALGFFFPSTEHILALDPFEYPVWRASVNTKGAALPEPGGVVDTSSSTLALGLLNYIHQPLGGEDYTCDGCGGLIQIGAQVEGETVQAFGTIRLTRPPVPDDPPGHKAIVDLHLAFSAAMGSFLDGGSPFLECAIEYDP